MIVPRPIGELSALLQNLIALPLLFEDNNGLLAVDEASIKVKKEWVSLYQTVNSQGNTFDFWVSATRDTKAAKHFFNKALMATHTRTP